MEIAEKVQRTNLPAWVRTLASLLPLWLVSLTLTAEGFPQPPISIELAFGSLTTAILISIVLLLKSWTRIELIVYSFIPLFFLTTFDEISTSYKTPFIFASALILTIGALSYQYFRGPRQLTWLILLVFALLALFAAGRASGNFWHMASELGYELCFPDYQGCAALTGQETPWWVLFFSI